MKRGSRQAPATGGYCLPAPVAMAKKVGPIVIAAGVGYRRLKSVMKARKEKRAILKVIESYEEARAEEEDAAG